MEPITKFPDDIPPRKGKAKVTKDLDSDKFFISMPLLLEQVPFGGLCPTWIPLPKMEYCDLVDHDRFPHLVTTNYMMCVYYTDSGVTAI